MIKQPVSELFKKRSAVLKFKATGLLILSIFIYFKMLP